MANSENTTQQKNWKKVMCVILSIIMAFGTFLSMTVGSLFLSDHFGVKTAYAAENDVNAPHFYRYNELVGLYKTNYQNEEKLQYKIGEDGEWTEYKLPFTIPAFETTRVYARVGENGTIVYDDLTVTGEALGVYTESSTDFEFSYKNIDFGYTRTYNSLRNEWFDSIDSRVVIVGGRMEIYLPDGSKYVLVKTDDDTYLDELFGYSVKKENNCYICDTGYYKYYFNNFLCAIEDNSGNRLDLIYDGNGLMNDTISDGNGRTFAIEDCFNWQNVVYERRIIDPNRNNIEYISRYYPDVNSPHNDYCTVTDQAGVIVGQYEYEDESIDARLIRSMDKSIEYYGNGRLKSITYDDGSYINYTYDDENMLFTTLTSSGAGTRTVYNDAFLPVSYTDESGVTTTFSYEDNYRLSSQTEGDTTTEYAYDEDGNLLSCITQSTDEEEHAYYTYDEYGQVIREQIGDNYTYYTYDDNGNVLVYATLKKDFEGEIPKIYNSNLTCFDVTKYTYGEDGNILKEKSSAGDIFEYEYDEYGNVTKKTATVVKNEGAETTVTTYIYDVFGNILAMQCGDNKSSYIYDSAGRVLLANENGKCTRTLYDEYGRVIQEISPQDYNSKLDGLPNKNTYSNSNVGQRYFYNNKNQVVKEINRLGVTTTYEYYSTGEKKSENFDIYKYYYNTNGSLTDVYVGGKNTVSYEYDDNNNIVLEAYANGQSIRYAYDDNNNLIAQYHDSDVSPYVTYTYNAENVLTEKLNTDANLRYVYGENGHVSIYEAESDWLIQSYTEVTTEADEETDAEVYTTITEEHFGAKYTSVITDNSITYTSGGNTLSYTYETDDDYRMKSDFVKFNNDDVMNFSYSYDENSNVTKKMMNFRDTDNSFDYDATYDAQNRLKSTHFVIFDNEYFYDEMGRLSRTNDVYTATTYEYDSRGNLEYRTKYYGTQDKNINTSYQERKQFCYLQEYPEEGPDWEDMADFVCTDKYSYDVEELKYDNIGNLISCNDTQFTWSSGKNLESITDGENTYSYTYDENGIRTSKTINGVTTHFNTKDGVILSQTDGTNTMYFQYEENGTPLGFILNDTQYFYLTNQMGDVIGIVNGNGILFVVYNYDEWGNIVEIVDDGTEEGCSLAQFNPIRYRGYYYDNETGYYYLQSRYYNPQWCRFINADAPEIPLVAKSEAYVINLFSYCNNDPINFVDRRGFIRYPRLSNVGDTVIDMFLFTYLFEAAQEVNLDLFGKKANDNFAALIAAQIVVNPDILHPNVSGNETVMDALGDWFDDQLTEFIKLAISPLYTILRFTDENFFMEFFSATVDENELFFSKTITAHLKISLSIGKDSPFQLMRDIVEGKGELYQNDSGRYGYTVNPPRVGGFIEFVQKVSGKVNNVFGHMDYDWDFDLTSFKGKLFYAFANAFSSIVEIPDKISQGIPVEIVGLATLVAGIIYYIIQVVVYVASGGVTPLPEPKPLPSG